MTLHIFDVTGSNPSSLPAQMSRFSFREAARRLLLDHSNFGGDDDVTTKASFVATKASLASTISRIKTETLKKSWRLICHRHLDDWRGVKKTGWHLAIFFKAATSFQTFVSSFSASWNFKMIFSSSFFLGQKFSFRQRPFLTDADLMTESVTKIAQTLDFLLPLIGAWWAISPKYVASFWPESSCGRYYKI